RRRSGRSVSWRRGGRPRGGTGSCRGYGGGCGASALNGDVRGGVHPGSGGREGVAAVPRVVGNLEADDEEARALGPAGGHARAGSIPRRRESGIGWEVAADDGAPAAGLA